MRSIHRGLESVQQGKAFLIFFLLWLQQQELSDCRRPGPQQLRTVSVCSRAPANCSVAVLGSQRQQKLQGQEPQRPECWGLHYFICISRLLCGHLKALWMLESITNQHASKKTESTSGTSEAAATSTSPLTAPAAQGAWSFSVNTYLW